MSFCQFYIIHNLEKKRKSNILRLLRESNISNNNINFINHPNKNEITYEIKKNAVQKNVRINNKVIKDGWIAVSYKHYLALEDIVKNQYPYAVIMEDNIGQIHGNIYERIGLYHKELPVDWNIVFESDQKYLNFDYTREGEVLKDKLIYKKNNEISYDDNGNILLHGGSRSAQFYYLKLETAMKLYENYLPFNHAPDMWMNDLFRKLNINSFWAEPTFITTEKNHKTSTNFNYLRDFRHIIYSKYVNKRLGL